MIPKVFFDTNIVLDLIDLRDGYEESARILQQQSDGHIEACISMLSMANIAYVLRKRNPGFIVPTLLQISSLFTVLPINQEQLHMAIMSMEGPDFEDLLQCACAIQNGCEFIVTRNSRDFVIKNGINTSPVIPETMSPKDFLARV